MVAGVLAGFEVSVEVSEREGFRFVSRCADDDIDALLLEEGLSALAHAAGDDDIGLLFGQPAGQDSWLVGGRCEKLQVAYGLLLFVHVYKRELLAMAEVHCQFTFCCRDGDFHGFPSFCYDASGSVSRIVWMLFHRSRTCAAAGESSSSTTARPWIWAVVMLLS